MDTVLTDEASLLSSNSVPPPEARLPGESVFDTLRQTPKQESSEQAPRQPLPHAWRKRVLPAAALVVILGAMFSVGYLERARLAHIRFLHRDLTSQPKSQAKPVIADNDVTLPSPVHPQAVTAIPTAQTSVKAASPPLKPQPALRLSVGNSPSIGGPVNDKPTVPTAQTDLREFTALQKGSPALPPTSSTAARPPSEPLATKVANPSLPAARPPETSTTAVPGAAPPPVGQGTAATQIRAPAPQPTPADPVAEAASLQPGPMTPREQVDVLNLIEKLGIVVRDLRDENAQLRTAVKNLSEEVDTKTTQLDRRLSLAEANGAIAAAMGAGQTTQQATVVVTAHAPMSAKSPAANPAPPMPPPLVRSVKDYRIQAASPGLAMLSAVGTSDGDTSSIQVAVGDEVPGVGHIKAIYQKGTDWVVETDHGLIE